MMDTLGNEGNIAQVQMFSEFSISGLLKSHASLDKHYVYGSQIKGKDKIAAVKIVAPL